MRQTPGWRPTRRPKSTQREIDEELRFHIEGRVEELIADGLSPAEALKYANERFGDVETVRSSCIQLQKPHAPSGRPFTMRLFSHDFRYAVRSLLKRPAYAASIMATLALAIGATTSVFSVVNSVLLRPLPLPDPDQVVRLWEVDQRAGFFDDQNRVAVANYGDWREQNRVFDAIAAFQQYPVTLREGEEARQVTARFVTADFFKVLGIDAAIGRTFLPEEDAPDARRVVVISHNFWIRDLAGDPDVLNRTLANEIGVFPIVGVLPPEFDRLDTGVEVLSTLGLRPNQFGNRRSHVIDVIARIKPGLSTEDAQRDMNRIVDGLRPQYPQFLEGWGVNVKSLTNTIVGDVRPALLVLQGGVAVLLLIAVVNVTNIMLARTAAEQRELAIRTALGAGRGRLIAQKFSEALAMAFVGGILGVALAHVAVRVLVQAAPAGLPMVDQIAVSLPVLAFAFVVTTLSAMLFALAPALQASKPNISHAMRTRGTGVDRVHHRLRSGLVIAQLAFSLTLLISAGLLVNTFLHLMRVDPGFQTRGIATARITLPTGAYPTSADQANFYDRVLKIVRSQPGVVNASATKFLPMSDQEWTWSVQIEGQPGPAEGEKRDYGRHVVMPGYFETMNIALLQGRLIDDSDRPDHDLVAVVNEAFVNRFFPAGESAIGRRFQIGSEDGLLQIVGVVGDTHHYALDAAPVPAYYAPLGQVPDNFRFGTWMSLVIRTEGDPAGALSTARTALRSVDPTVVMSQASTMVEHVSESVARSRFAMTLLSTFAGLAAALAMVGVYGVVSYSVGEKTREIGVRLALGARGPSILRSIVGQTTVLASAGVVIGMGTAVFVTRFQTSLLFGVSNVDPLTYGTLAASLITVAAGAAFLPAYRASRTDPMHVLREE